MSRADSALRHAVELQDRLKAAGNHRDAEIVRAICHSFRVGRSTNAVLHRDNRTFRNLPAWLDTRADRCPSRLGARLYRIIADDLRARLHEEDKADG
ncbi:hypothetical protein ACIPPQ_20410 [Sphingopyxis sp. LARHCG72]